MPLQIAGPLTSLRYSPGFPLAGRSHAEHPSLVDVHDRPPVRLRRRRLRSDDPRADGGQHDGGGERAPARHRCRGHRHRPGRLHPQRVGDGDAVRARAGRLHDHRAGGERRRPLVPAVRRQPERDGLGGGGGVSQRGLQRSGRRRRQQPEDRRDVPDPERADLRRRRASGEGPRRVPAGVRHRQRVQPRRSGSAGPLLSWWRADVGIHHPRARGWEFRSARTRDP